MLDWVLNKMGPCTKWEDRPKPWSTILLGSYWVSQELTTTRLRTCWTEQVCINEIVVRQSALASWKASQGGALQDLLQPYDDRTRGSSSNLRKPISQRCTAAKNMCTTWNASCSLREAKSLAEARRAARELAKSVRHKWPGPVRGADPDRQSWPHFILFAIHFPPKSLNQSVWFDLI